MSDFVERRIAGHTVRIDRETCIGSGNCLVVTPKLFVLDEEDIVAFGDGGSEVAAEQLAEACRVCPVDALILLDGDGRQLVP